MRFLFIIVILFLLCSFSIGVPDIIVWDKNQPLTWDDFQGKPAHRFAAASTNYDILKSALKKSTDVIGVNIKAVFYTKRSWKKNTWVNDQVLAHEQKHFDIVELFARKLRKKIINTNYKSYEELMTKMDSLYNQNDTAMDAYQDKYDDETDGSMDGDMQREWNTKIINELKELEMYKNYSFEVVLKNDN